MGTFLLSLVLVCLAVTGLAAGLLFGRRPLSASCGASAVCWICPRRRHCRRDAPPPDRS